MIRPLGLRHGAAADLGRFDDAHRLARLTLAI